MNSTLYPTQFILLKHIYFSPAFGSDFAPWNSNNVIVWGKSGQNHSIFGVKNRNIINERPFVRMWDIWIDANSQQPTTDGQLLLDEFEWNKRQKPNQYFTCKWWRISKTWPDCLFVSCFYFMNGINRIRVKSIAKKPVGFTHS